MHRARLLRPALGAAFVATLAALPGLAAAAPTISGADGDVWNAEDGSPTYVITGTVPGALVSGRFLDDDGAFLGAARNGPSPLTVTLDDAPEGGVRLIARQSRPADPGRTPRTFTVDTLPPTIDVTRPAAGAVYQRGARVLAAFSCAGDPESCVGTVADGAPLPTGTTGTKVFTVRATDGAGNEAEERIEYQVGAPAAPAPPPSGAPAGTPTPPSPTIRLAPAPTPTGGGTALPTSEADRLRPAAGAVLTDSRPVLRWAPVRGARLYNVQVFRVRGEQATKVLSEFPSGTRLRIPGGRLRWDERYLWRVWPLVNGSYPDEAHGQSWFSLRRPVRLTPAQLLVNQRISQAALRRTAAISAWLDAGIVTDDLRDGGLAREDFAGDVTIAGQGQAIANGLAAPRSLTTATPARSGSPRIRVSARQLLVNQRISQAAVRRANALSRRLEGGLTGGDLRPGAVAAVKLAPGLSVAAARPAGPGPAASRTDVRAAGRSSGGAVRLTDRQVLINQRIAQAAVRRANEMRAIIAGGLTGANFADGAVAAASIDPALRG